MRPPSRPPVDNRLPARRHGDLHVGQVLRSTTSSGHTYAVTDFDGNPVAPSTERLREQPAAVDVAGIVQSLRHAALVLRRHQPNHDPVVTAAMSAAMRSAFLHSYRRGLADAGQRRLFDDRLLGPLSLRQVCREFTYAALHLPRWSYVPEAALPALLEDSVGW
jgi:maltokinase